VLRLLQAFEGLKGAGALLAVHGHAEQQLHGLAADAFVAVALHALGERRRIGQALDGRAADAGVLVRAGDLAKHVLLVRGKLADGSGTCFGILALPGGTRAESVEEGHFGGRSKAGSIPQSRGGNASGLAAALLFA
jgi:hypothetical protein